ncbi:unnamed protein product [Moneuplotes crassus]|uniref:COPI associated protein n=2 Tax=Euplotes crassus TaxID=5936 RepID=A0AAD2D882_EUPCR|nr:unnamed protein product [Moneuplotes crassus]
MVQVNIAGGTLFKIIYIALALTVIVFGIVSLISFSGGVIAVFFRIYSIMFGALLLISEFNLEFIKKYFFFMKKTIGKGVFCIIMASTLLNTNNWYSWGFAIGFAAIGVIFILLSFFVQDTSEDDVYNDTKV